MAKQVRIYTQGAPDVMQTEHYVIPALAASDVLIRHQAIGVNFVDTMFRDGTFNMPLPFAMGVEAAGIIEAIGSAVTKYKVGDRVGYFFSFGAYSDQRVIHSDKLISLPEDISTEHAAALLSKGLTAWALLTKAYQLKAGDTVLVQGASGGVGAIVSHWAKAIGATVITTVGSSHKASIVSRWGFDTVLDYTKLTITNDIMALTAGKGVDVVYDMVGKSTIPSSVASLKPHGTLVHVGNASGNASVNRQQLAAKNIVYIQPATPNYVTTQNQSFAATELFERFRNGDLGPLDITKYPLDRVIDVHQAIHDRKHTGSVILIP